jgi:succinate dehydrogenase / fumarate reductase cytochrome b subunit
MIFWCFSSAWIYHLLAGIRHIIMDLGYGEDLHTGKNSATVILILASVYVILLGVWIW